MGKELYENFVFRNEKFKKKDKINLFIKWGFQRREMF